MTLVTDALIAEIEERIPLCKAANDKELLHRVIDHMDQLERDKEELRKSLQSTLETAEGILSVAKKLQELSTKIP